MESRAEWQLLGRKLKGISWSVLSKERTTLDLAKARFRRICQIVPSPIAELETEP